MEFVILIGLVLLNGILSMSEIAVVSSRTARLQRLADEGRHGAARALALHKSPSTFLSTIQVGITTVGILSGVVGESAFVTPLAERLGRVPPLAAHAEGIALALVVVALTYVTVVVGELVPKRLGLLRPEALALVIAPAMAGLAALARPLVWLFSTSSDLILRLLRVRRSTEPTVTDEEIDVLMEQGAEAGVFHESEQEIVANVLRLDEQRIGAIMTPRKDLFFVDLEDGEEELRRQLAEAPHHRVIVCQGGIEHVLGVVHVTDLLRAGLTGQPLALEKILRQPLVVPESVTTTQIMEHFRRARTQFALIVDEYGGLQGIVTLSDVLSAIVGEIPEEGVAAVSDAVQRSDGSWLVDGEIGLERFRDLVAVENLPGEEEGDFHTLAGFVLHHLGRIPAAADRFEVAGLSFEIVDMDRNRIDKLIVARAPLGGAPGAE
jgi:putative hemolysin